MNTMIPISADPQAKSYLAEQLSETSGLLGQRLKRVGLGAIAAVLLLGAFVPFESGALAPGHVMVENKRKTVQHLDGGIIRAIHVREGAVVKAGAPLLTLDDNSARLNVSVYQAQVDALRAEQAVLEAQLLGKPAIVFPADLLARRNEPNVANIIRSQTAAFSARRENVGGRKAQLSEQFGQIGEEIQGDHASAAAREEQLRLLDSEIADIELLFAKGFATKARLLALKRAAAQVRGERAALHSEAAKLRIRQSEVQIQSLQVERESASEAGDALRMVQTQLTEAQDKLSASRQILERIVIRAPVAGTVVGLRPTTVGGVIQAGEPLMDVIPNSGRLIVTARVPPNHADKLRVGQQADVRFDAAGVRSAPVVGGRVQTFSADALTDARTGDLYFEAQVAVPEAAARKLSADLRKPGVPADVLLKTGRRTAFGYMFAPINRARFHALREQ